MRWLDRLTAKPEPLDCGDVYPYHSSTPHWHVGYPREKRQSFDKPKWGDPFDGPEDQMFVNKKGQP